MTKTILTCGKCEAPIPEERFNTAELTTCPECGVLMRVLVFPALYKGVPRGLPGERLVMDDEASCYYHPNKKAVIPCDHCGRFLCALCNVELNGQHLCPHCLESEEKKGHIKQLEKRRTLYDGIAVRLAIYPLILIFVMWPFTLLTSPAALFIALRHWNDPPGVLPRSKIRYIVAILFATLQIGVWLYWGFLMYQWLNS